jgi:hypothetical protein
MGSRTRAGLALVEIIVSFGILAAALLTLLSVSAMALRYQRQNINNMNAARVTDMVLNRAVSRVLSEDPVGPLNADFFGGDYPKSGGVPYEEGTVMVGREEFTYELYTYTVPGIGDPSAVPIPNILKKVDAYVYWKETGQGERRSFSCRLVNQGEQP